MTTSRSIQIKPGNYYKLRNGSKAYMVARLPCRKEREDVWVGEWFEGKSWVYSGWKEHGGYLSDGGRESGLDIVASWPETVKVWFRQLPSGKVYCYWYSVDGNEDEKVWSQEVNLTPPQDAEPEEPPPF